MSAMAGNFRTGEGPEHYGRRIAARFFIETERAPDRSENSSLDPGFERPSVAQAWALRHEGIIAIPNKVFRYIRATHACIEIIIRLYRLIL
jgi:hypothetical protein